MQNTIFPTAVVESLDIGYFRPVCGSWCRRASYSREEITNGPAKRQKLCKRENWKDEVNKRYNGNEINQVNYINEKNKVNRKNEVNDKIDRQEK